MKRILFLTILAAACTKNEAEQTADWNKNVETAQKYGAKYSAFKSVLEKRTTEAQASFDTAKQVADKEARAEAMGAANKMLTELLGEFSSYESASKSLSDSLAKHSSLPSGLEAVANSAKEAQKTAERNMGGFEPSNVGAAKLKIEDAITTLKEATDALASTDGYVTAEKQLSELMADKEILALPAGKVNPTLEAAKTAQRNAGYALTEAGGAPPAMAKAAVLKATKILTEATGPLKALKPAPAAAPAKTVAKK
jgi:hypothetical protein